MAKPHSSVAVPYQIGGTAPRFTISNVDAPNSLIFGVGMPAMRHNSSSASSYTAADRLQAGMSRSANRLTDNVCTRSQHWLARQSKLTLKPRSCRDTGLLRTIAGYCEERITSEAIECNVLRYELRDNAWRRVERQLDDEEGHQCRSKSKR
jgi:hypothetical protein